MLDHDVERARRERATPSGANDLAPVGADHPRGQRRDPPVPGDEHPRPGRDPRQHSERGGHRLHVRPQHERQAHRQRQHAGGGHHHLIGERAVAIDAEPARGLAPASTDARARAARRERDHGDRRPVDPAGQLVAEHATGRDRDHPVGDREVGPAHPGVRHLDDHLTGTRHGRHPVDERDPAGAAPQGSSSNLHA